MRNQASEPNFLIHHDVEIVKKKSNTITNDANNN